MNFLKNFTSTFIVAIISLTLAFLWGLLHGPNAGLDLAVNMLGITIILAVLELSLSLDNSIVNASILKHWNPFWQKMFLTVGFLTAVVGMRLLFPIVIVAFTTDMSSLQVLQLAINDPVTYSKNLLDNYAVMVMFGGMFLWMVFSDFMFDFEREDKWVKPIENLTAKIGKIPYVSYFFAVSLLLIAYVVKIPVDAINAGFTGLAVYAGIQCLGNLLEKFSGSSEEEGEGNAKLATNTVKGGIGGFMYLEVLDASYSLDGVVGALSITNDIIIIMAGLAIGAMAVRCLTIYLVNEGTLDEYKYLEHGAMYAIGALALFMLSSVLGYHAPELVVGSVGIVFIGIALYHSIIEKTA